MKLANVQMEWMARQLEPLLPRRDKMGYLAARNTRVLADALAEYRAFRDGLVARHGERDVDENGNELPTMSISIDSPNFNAFMEELAPLNGIEQDVDILTCRYEEAAGVLSGEEILALDWMFEN